MEQAKDKSNFGIRATRYGKVSVGVAGLAAKMAGEKYLGIAIDRDRHAQDLVAALGNLKGPLMKIGQILATVPEALPPEYTKAFRQLQSNAPPMGWTFVKRRMKAELDEDWETKFKHFDRDSSAAASLGQVHKAMLHDGRLVACKLQYPDMGSVIEADLNQLKLIFSLYEKYDSAIATRHIHDELAARLHEELDYALEARHGRLYAHILKNEKAVHVPEIIDDLSTGRLLTATWLEGKAILSFKDAPQETRNQIALNMFRTWYVPLYFYGVIHGDPHLGNYSVRDDLSINLLDFGCVRVFPPRFVGGVIDLYNALLKNDTALAVHAFETWGFTNLNKDQIEALTLWARFLYAPILDDRVRPIGEVKNGIYGKETAEEVHKRLREAGKGVAVPREFVFMDRAALGLGSVFLHLKAEVNWYRLFNEMIDGFDVKTLQERQTRTLKLFKVTESSN
jgi:predicted unusual protein kinase regulating ubiquinone biosynthesis (AarF/ABC1/UbiB family)